MLEYRKIFLNVADSGLIAAIISRQSRAAGLNLTNGIRNILNMPRPHAVTVPYHTKGPLRFKGSFFPQAVTLLNPTPM
ncbi:unnamed protein product [Arctogadus glacialis]